MNVKRALLPLLCLMASAPAWAEGLETVREPLGRLVALEVRDGRLVLDRAKWTHVPRTDDRREALRREKAAQFKVPPEAIPDAVLDEDPGVALTADPRELFRSVVSVGEELSEESGGSRSVGRADEYVLLETEFVEGQLTIDLLTTEFELSLTETAEGGMELRIEEDPDRGLWLAVTWPAESLTVTLVGSANGRVSVVGRRGDRNVSLSAASMEALLKSSPDETSLILARPLERLGIFLPPRRFLPEVIAAATSGFGAASPEVARAVDEAVGRLSDEDSSTREGASAELETLLPRAIGKVREALAATDDAEVRVRLEGLLASRPDLDRAVSYARETGLHEDRDYLIEVLRDVPAYRAAARARLTELCGQDHGDDPAAWPTGR